MSVPVTKRVSVDRVEGDTAVLLEGRTEIQVPAAWLPQGAGEGAWLQLTLAADAGATDDARARVQRLTSQLKRR